MNFSRLSLCAFMVPLALCGQQSGAPAFQHSLDHSMASTHGSAVVVEVATGRVLATFDLNAASPRAPGSTLKPLVAAIALRDGAVTDRTTAECHGNLVIGGHNLACSHPRTMTIFDLHQAIAYSCNSWFAQLAEHLTSAQLTTGLRSYQLNPSTVASTPEQRKLLTLGVNGIRITPLQLAQAYRILALRLHQPSLSAVQAGMLDSVRYGMAHNAAVVGLMLAGKTGTVANSSLTGTSGWFAGIVFSPTQQPSAVIVIAIPHGTGADAADLARHCLLDWLDRNPHP
jgi:cell division protein FtsI/penicillin-binding protein 2